MFLSEGSNALTCLLFNSILAIHKWSLISRNNEHQASVCHYRSSPPQLFNCKSLFSGDGLKNTNILRIFYSQNFTSLEFAARFTFFHQYYNVQKFKNTLNLSFYKIPYMVPVQCNYKIYVICIIRP